MKRKILSIDGGGIKGIYAASFLAELEKYVPEGKCLADYFDIITGTSTGAIIAAGIAVGVPVKVCLDMYREKGQEIFPPRPAFWHFLFPYRTEPLRKNLESVFGNKIIDDCRTRLEIPTYNITENHARILKTRHYVDYVRDYKVKIVDALLATTAAPTFFLPHTITEEAYDNRPYSYIDGGVGGNNPSIFGLTEAIARLDWSINDIYMLSVSCLTRANPVQKKLRMSVFSVPKLIDFYMKAENMYSENTCHMVLKDRFYRIEAKNLNRDYRMDYAGKKELDEMILLGKESAKRFLRGELEDKRPGIIETFLDKPAERYQRIEV